MGTTLADVDTGPVDSAQSSYLQVARRLLGAARDLVGVHAADDLVFDTMSTLLPRWSSISGDKVAYARRSMLNRYRDQGRHQKVQDSHQRTLATPDREDSAADRVAARLDMSTALQRLPERTRQVPVLRYQLDLPAAEVAAALGIPAGSVRRIAHEGLKTLSQLLGPAEGTKP
ncbi:sigma-70 family RNA polymerase sigma factor [Nakamurella sp. A5-74]|uniref:Sigma-70 family RNA polymerase sigma factor n=1 Tax=Nakamurella sp. A5-74 TaxID=3158264 RepID=A0AAU8DNU3_9ACTN